MATSRIQALTRLLQADPGDATAHYMLGHEYFKAGMYREAVEALGRYLARADDEGAAYRTLAESLLRLGRRDEARQAFRDGLAAATRHGHQPLIAEYTAALAALP
ncbi:MAG: tetratricopeptide repeat protein [Candidatus Methylomirabilales bacterium]